MSLSLSWVHVAALSYSRYNLFASFHIPIHTSPSRWGSFRKSGTHRLPLCPFQMWKVPSGDRPGSNPLPKNSGYWPTMLCKVTQSCPLEISPLQQDSTVLCLSQFYVWLLNPAAKCAILSIEKGKAIEAALPSSKTNLTSYEVSRHYGSSGGYFFFPL